MQRVSIVCLMIIATIFVSGCSAKEKINDMFDSFEMETVKEVAYMCYDTLVYEDEVLNFRDVLKNNQINGIFHEVYVIQNNTVWFGFSDSERNEKGARKWNIATVSMDGSMMEIVYSGEFCQGEKADQTYIQNSNCHKKERYSAASGFYYDGKIVLTDHMKTVEFDIQTVSSKEITVEDLNYPILEVEVDIEDVQTITFCKNSEVKIFNIERAKETSGVFEQLYGLENKKNWQGESYLSKLFDKVQIVDNQIYIICRVMNWNGETHAIVFQYDFGNNSCQYAFHQYMDDLVGNNLYVIPMID